VHVHKKGMRQLHSFFLEVIIYTNSISALKSALFGNRRSYYATEEELKIAVQNHVEYFNDYRPHQCLGFKTPNQAESEYFEKQKKEKMLRGN
jgi:hypothetical protein